VECYGGLRFCEDMGPAHWLQELHVGERHWGTAAGMCAPGYAAYARILHPAWHETSDGVLSECTWSEIAKANGKHMHPLAFFTEITTVDGVKLFEQPKLWTHGPANGGPPAGVAMRLVGILARHTRSPESCWFGLWEGYGALEDRIPADGPRFLLPGRGYILLRGPLAAVLSCAELPRLPDRWWPEDHAWCLGGDVDTECAYIAGSEQLIAEVLADSGLEAYQVQSSDNT
jgi:hypothetical protein